MHVTIRRRTRQQEQADREKADQRLVLCALKHISWKPLTIAALVDESGLSQERVTRAIEQLECNHQVFSHPYFRGDRAYIMAADWQQATNCPLLLPYLI